MGLAFGRAAQAQAAGPDGVEAILGKDHRLVERLGALFAKSFK